MAQRAVVRTSGERRWDGCTPAAFTGNSRCMAAEFLVVIVLMAWYGAL
jgi:hypothetical protein